MSEGKSIREQCKETVVGGPCPICDGTMEYEEDRTIGYVVRCNKNGTHFRFGTEADKGAMTAPTA
jgi:hypothetical protein